MERDFSYLSPSQAFARIDELSDKQHYEELTSEELEEINSLRMLFEESLSDYNSDF